MNPHTDDTFRAEAGHRREHVIRTRPRWSSRRGEANEEKPMNQPMPKPSPRDEAAVRGIVADIEQAFNDNDPAALVKHIAADAVIVNPLGEVLRGPAAVEASVRPLLIGGPLQDATAYYRLTDVTLLAPTVIVALKSAWPDRQTASDGAPPEMHALYVFAARDDRWWVLRRQNTTVGN